MQHWPRPRLWLTVALIGTLALLAACGQKGPLYLPSPDDTTHTHSQKDR
ncbi:MAG: lipoprotein [Candidatus Thiodiazotropha sp.]